MSPRRRTVPNEDILAATARVISRVGPSRLTLADVGREVGLSAATLVQRFGSKRGLLLSLARAAPESVEASFAALRAAHLSPLAALLAAATGAKRQARNPEELANHLAFGQIDLSDPDFHRLALDHSELLHAGYRELLDEAVATGELAPCDTGRLARAVGAMAGGSLIAWAIHREGPVEAWVLEDLTTLLAPHRRDPATKARGRRARKA